ISGQEYSNSAMVALSNTTFLVLERDGDFYRDNSKAFKRVYKIDLRSATNLEAVAVSGGLAQDAALGLTIDGKTLEQII
ncbi:esterase-like activity of phytase family protein, partial [Escherichia coli]|uniref:esterase-like activity of phytase family protein n=1 Tax=Escherichia coli TaxID=562 RepID=UPI0028DF2033